MLGEFRLACDGEVLQQIGSGRLLSLFGYLALHPETPQPRQYLAFLLWPDATESQARNNLRQLLHQMRRLWPAAERYLAISGGALQWSPDLVLDIDVSSFVGAMRRASDAVQHHDIAAESGALQEAVQRYRGELLPSCYDEWLAPERERLHQLFVQALDRLIEILESQQQYSAAIQHAQECIRQDSLDENAYARLIRLHALNHDRTSALRVYHRCADVLERELSIAPSPATRELYEHLIQPETLRQDGRDPSPVTSPRLVGRQEECARLVALWQHAARGEAQLALISGDPGVGKSRLAEELTGWATGMGVDSARSRAYAAEGRLAYAPVTDLLRSDAIHPTIHQLAAAWTSELARLLPELLTDNQTRSVPSLAQPGQRQRLFEALARAVLGAGRPLLLVLDDLQWADQDTLEWLHYLLRFNPAAPLLVVATARTEDIQSTRALETLLTDLRREGQLTEIELGPLDAVETRELATLTAGRTFDMQEASAVFRESEGNPLFVVEAVRAGVTHDGQLPPRVQGVITARLLQLSEPARDLVGIAATIGRAFDLAVLAGAYGGDETTLVHALDELWRRRILREHGTSQYGFAHDKLREVSYSLLNPAVRRLMHRRVAEVLQQVHAGDLDPVSAQLGSHFDKAGLFDQAVAFYQRAAQVAERVYASADAITLLNRALALLGDSPPSSERDERELALQTAMGVALVAVKGYGAPEVVEVHRRSHVLSQGLGRPPSPPMLRALAIASLTHTDFQQAHDLGDHLLSLAERDRDPMLLVEAHYVLGVTLFWKGSFEPARIHLEEALAHYEPERSAAHLAAYTQDPGVVCSIRLAVVHWFLGDQKNALRRRNESLALAARVAHPFSLGYALAWDAVLQFLRGEARATQKQAEAAVSISLEHGLQIWLAMSAVLRGWAIAEQGESKLGIEAMQAGMEAFRATGSIYTRPLFLGLLADQQAKTGHHGLALSLLDEALGTVQSTGERCWESMLYWRKGELLMHDDEPDEARAAFEQARKVAAYQRARRIEQRASASLSRLTLS